MRRWTTVTVQERRRSVKTFTQTLIIGVCLLGLTSSHESGDSMAAIPPVFGALLPRAAEAIFGSVISGFGRRIESKFAGADARSDYATSNAAQSALAQGAYSTDQYRSQGQQQAFSQSQSTAYNTQADKMQTRGLAATSMNAAAQRRHEKEMLGMELSAQGVGSSGELPWWLGGGPGSMQPSPAPSGGRLQNVPQPSNVPDAAWDFYQDPLRQ